MRHQGRITRWNDDKGFGFITPIGGGEPLFLHISAFADRQRRPKGNEIVSYEAGRDEQGRPRATAAAFPGQRPPKVSRQGPGHWPLILAGSFLLLVVGSVVTRRLPFAILALYLIASVVAFLAYAFDKSAAQRQRWRTKESTLHLFALLGGWPGALAAQRLLRHKSSKTSFQLAFWMTVAMNCSAFGWLFSPTGARTLRSLLGST